MLVFASLSVRDRKRKAGGGGGGGGKEEEMGNCTGGYKGVQAVRPGSVAGKRVV